MDLKKYKKKDNKNHIVISSSNFFSHAKTYYNKRMNQNF